MYNSNDFFVPLSAHNEKPGKKELERARDMTTVCFDQRSIIPDERGLRGVLGEAYPCHLEILDLTKSYAQEWKFYGKKYGWQLKVTHKGKALCYVSPLEKSLTVGLGIREEEKDILLNSKLPVKMKQELKSAKKYAEGYPLRIQIRRKSEMRTLRWVLKVLIESRS